MPESRTLFLLLAEFGTGQIPVEKCCHHFGMKADEAKRAASPSTQPAPRVKGKEMVKRERVEGLLKRSEQVYGDSFLIVDKGELAELCRTWLAVDGAPVVTLDAAIQHSDSTLEVSGLTPEAEAKLDGQRVKLVLVPEADSGGDRG